ncbi:MAG: hypothetical protein E6Q97_15855 [Desulfurellales bacterium]|nr:MAG: hypothetical protein E6Q97_15855 [Desulfurellales bacterium]
MRITLATATTIRLHFPFNAATVAFVKALPGAEWDKESKTWLVGLVALARLVQRFLRSVEVEYEVFVARDEMWRRWVRQHNACGVRFEQCGSVAVATGPGVSPEFAKFVASRSAQIAPWLGCQVEARRLVTPLQPSFVEPSDADGLLMRSMRNAAQRAEERAEMIERVKAKGKRGRQMSLLEEIP